MRVRNGTAKEQIPGFNTHLDKLRRIVGFRLIILLLLLFYSGLAAYSGHVMPLRLVVGTSMEPALHAGDVVLIKAIPFSEIERGDLIVYESPVAIDTAVGGTPDMILHRVVDERVERNQRVLYTKGDNSLPDPWSVTSDAVKGEMAFRIPLLGIPLLYLKDPRVALMVLGVSMLAVALVTTVRLRVWSKAKAPVPSVADYFQMPENRHASAGILYEDAADHPDATESSEVQPFAFTSMGTEPDVDVEAQVDSLLPGFLGVNRYWEDVDAPAPSPVERPEFPFLTFNSKWIEASPIQDLQVEESATGLQEVESGVNESIQQLGNTVAAYAVQLQAHSKAMDELADVTRLLENAVARREAPDVVEAGDAPS